MRQYYRIEDRMLQPDIHYQVTFPIRTAFFITSIFWTAFDVWYSIYFFSDDFQSMFALTDIVVHQLFIWLLWFYYYESHDPVILKHTFRALFAERIVWFLFYVTLNAYTTSGKLVSVFHFLFYFSTMLCMSFWTSLFCSLL